MFGKTNKTKDSDRCRHAAYGSAPEYDVPDVILKTSFQSDISHTILPVWYATPTICHSPYSCNSCNSCNSWSKENVFPVFYGFLGFG